MQVGNVIYKDSKSLPTSIPIFPLSAGIILPQGHLPLNIFEPHIIDLVDFAMIKDRLIGMVQPKFNIKQSKAAKTKDTPLCSVGCVGRITSLQESGDGRYLIILTGICRFNVVSQDTQHSHILVGEVSYKKFASDFQNDKSTDEVDRDHFLTVLTKYLEANKLKTDWDDVAKASTDTLVNAIAMVSPFGPADKQALLEAETISERANTLIAITEMELAKKNVLGSNMLQ